LTSRNKKMCTPVKPAPWKVHADLGFSKRFVYELEARAGQTNAQVT